MNYVVTMKNGKQEVISADSWEFDKISCNSAVVFYQIKNDKREPCAYVVRVDNILETKE